LLRLQDERGISSNPTVKSLCTSFPCLTK